MFSVNGRAVEKTKFPDGQPHIKISNFSDLDISNDVTCRIANSEDLVNLLLVCDVLRTKNIPLGTLRISYLMGARMDRRIDNLQPFTLKVIADLINRLGFRRVELFDVHSEVATALIDNAVNILPINLVKYVMESFEGKRDAADIDSEVVLISPDLGAVKRAEAVADGHIVAHCHKHRDPQTGKLSNFVLLEPDLVKNKKCLIVDDICDGGGTFVGIADLLRKNGAKSVWLYVSHGIFSKGYQLSGIDNIWTTNSYTDENRNGAFNLEWNQKVQNVSPI